MPQGRIVRKRICQSRKLARLKTDGARLLYTWLLPNVDVEGRYEADVHVIKGTILTRLTKSTKEVESYLLDLAKNNLIVLYNCNGDRYLEIIDFHLHQPKLRKDREADSEIPGPTPEQLRTNSGLTPAEDKISKDKLREVKKSNNIHTQAFTLEDVLNHVPTVGFSDDEAEAFFYHYETQGWIRANGLPIINLASAMQYWKKNKHKFATAEEKQTEKKDKAYSDIVDGYLDGR